MIRTADKLLGPSTIGELRAAVRGRILVPGEPGYELARALYAPVDHRPSAIVRAADPRDVATTVRLAAERDLELAVRSGGHSPAGHGTTDGGIVLDLRGMKHLQTASDGASAWAETGLTAGEFTAAVGRLGRATGFGDTGAVGIGGITLSGGIGYLVRRHGLTIDNLLAADIVTADGVLRRVDEQSHPDLFWAIRGGGGNFGVATRFRYRLHQIDAVTAGTLAVTATSDTIAGYLAVAEEAPEGLSAVMTVLADPSDPRRLILYATLVHTGDPVAGERAVAPLRAVAEPIVDTVGRTRYRDLLPAGSAPMPKSVGRTMFLDTVDREIAGTIIDRIASATVRRPVVQLRVLGGAMSRIGDGATAFAHRDARVMANVGAVVEHPDQRPAVTAWVEESAALLPRRAGAAVGFLGDEGPDRVRQAYPGSTWHRLAEIKQRYDPANLFRRNQNIPPATADRP